MNIILAAVSIGRIAGTVVGGLMFVGLLAAVAFVLSAVLLAFLWPLVKR